MENLNKPFQHPFMTALFALLIVGLIVYLGILSSNAIKEGRYIGTPDTERDTITISGEGKVIAVPDIGQITVTIVSENKNVVQAQDQNISQFNNLSKDLKDSGIDEKDLKTTSYVVSPRYDWNEGGRIFQGYEVRQSLLVKIRDLDKAGSIISIAGQNGVNEVSGLNFTIDDPETVRKEARAKALDNAQEKAEELADLAGVKLGKIVSFSESSGGGQQPVYRNLAYEESADSKIAITQPDFEVGSEDVTVYVTIEYEIY